MRVGRARVVKCFRYMYAQTESGARKFQSSLVVGVTKAKWNGDHLWCDYAVEMGQLCYCVDMADSSSLSLLIARSFSRLRLTVRARSTTRVDKLNRLIRPSCTSEEMAPSKLIKVSESLSRAPDNCQSSSWADPRDQAFEKISRLDGPFEMHRTPANGQDRIVASVPEWTRDMVVSEPSL